MQISLTPQILLAAYSQGAFPMADQADSEFVHWICPEMRGQLPILDLHVSRSLKKMVCRMSLKSSAYSIRINSDFEQVMKQCAEETHDRTETWINHQILDAYLKLHQNGNAHSVECWQNDVMVGGLYGVSIGGAFFGESMFSRVDNASKVALVHLAARLHHAQYSILDTQFTNPHLEQFGVYEVPHESYLAQLHPVLGDKCIFDFEMDEASLIDTYFQKRALL